MVILCCIKGCTSEKYPGCNLSFHSFPTDEKIRKKWIKLTKVTGNVRFKKICPLHFRNEDFVIKGRSVHLKHGTVPTYLTPPFKTDYDMKMTLKSCVKSTLYYHDNHNKVDDKHIDNDDDYSYSANSDDDYEQDVDDDLQEDVQTKNGENTASVTNNSRCKCCLESDKLKSMWQEYCCDGDREVYGAMLVDCFALSWIKPKDPKANAEKICESCIIRLKDAVSFKTEVLASEQLLTVEIDTVEYDKLKQECDEVEEIRTEYLNLEYLEDDNDIDDNDNGINIDIDKTYDDSDQYNNSDKAATELDKIIEDNVMVVKLEKLPASEEQKEEAIKEDTITPRRKRTIPKKYKQYTSDDLQKAVDAVASGQMSQNSAAKRFKIPIRVLASALKSQVTIKREPKVKAKRKTPASTKKKMKQLYPEQNLSKAIDDVWNKRLTQTQASKHYKVPRSTIFGMLIKKYGRSTKPEPGEEHRPVKKKQVEGPLEMVKHTTNILAIMENSNATPIRCHGDGGYLCCFCDQQYPEPEDLKTHTMLGHDMKTKRTFTKGKRPSSYFVKLDISFLKCTVCDRDIDSLEALLTHFVDQHQIKIYNDIKNHILPFKFETQELRCTVCANVFNNFKVLQTHLNVHYPNYVCKVCNSGFVSSMILHSHSRGHVTGVFKCDACSKVYNTQRQLRCHQNLVHKQAYMASKCGYCHERFKSYHRKMDHLIQVHNVKPMTFVCNACDRSFKSQSALRIHRKRDHLMERKYACTECDMKFFARVMLDAHMLKHTGVREFQCDVCNKSYKRRHTLREHMRIHNNDRRFKCEQCGAAFVQKCSWRAHMRSKHGVIS